MVWRLPLVLLILVHTLHSEPVVIGYEEDYPPFSITGQNGTAEGVFIDLFNLIAEKKGLDIDFRPCMRPECIPQLLSGKLDVVAGVRVTPDTLPLLYGSTIVRLTTQLFLKKGLSPASPLEIEDTLGVLANSPVLDGLASKFPKLKIREFGTLQDFRDAVEDQRYAGFIYDVPDPIERNLRMKDPDPYYRYYHVITFELKPAVRQDDIALLELLIAGSQEITTQEANEIASKYNIYLEDEKDYRFVILLLSFVLILAVLAIILLVRKRRTKPQQDDDWEKILTKGETDRTEFKSSLRWDYHQEKSNKNLQQVITKTLAAFLNTNGGRLFIGVSDEGQVLGLERDYATMSKKNSDGFLLAMANLINQTLGKNVHRFLKIQIVRLEGQEICVVDIKKSDQPVFIGPKGDEEFYVRTTASSQPLSTKDALDYIRRHWSD